jgi:hypothetical protein
MVPGFEAPPAWSDIGGDYCTPFTWSSELFERSTEIKASLGKSPSQDKLTLTGNCLTELSLSQESPVLSESRLTHYLDALSSEQCFGHRTDITLCSRTPEKYPPQNAQIDRFEQEGSCEELLAVKDCQKNPAQDCTVRENCLMAQKRTKCKEARKINPVTDYGHGVISSKFGPLRDTELGIADLETYNSQFDASLRHGDLKPRDEMVSMGLHNLINFFADNIISIANDPVEEINEASTYFHRIYKYANNEFASGQEIAGGLTKSNLLYINDALTAMDTNKRVTTIAYAFIIVIVVLQLAFLTKQAGEVVQNYFGMTIIMQRFLDELRELEMQLAQRNDKRQNGFRETNLSKSQTYGNSELSDSESSISTTCASEDIDDTIVV